MSEPRIVARRGGPSRDGQMLVGNLPLAVALAMVMVFVAFLAGAVQSLIEPAAAPIIGNARTAFWWGVTYQDFPP